MSGVWWCQKCGIVWADPDGPPICRHGVPDPRIPPVRMEPLPKYHPLAVAS